MYTLKLNDYLLAMIVVLAHLASWILLSILVWLYIRRRRLNLSACASCDCPPAMEHDKVFKSNARLILRRDALIKYSKRLLVIIMLFLLGLPTLDGVVWVKESVIVLIVSQSGGHVEYVPSVLSNNYWYTPEFIRTAFPRPYRVLSMRVAWVGWMEQVPGEYVLGSLRYLGHLNCISICDPHGRLAYGVNLDAFKRALANTPYREIVLTGPNYDDKYISVIGSSELSYLDIRMTKATDAGARTLLQYNNIRWINASGTQVSDLWINTIDKMSKLKEIDVRHTNVTTDGIQKLRLRCPDVAVIGP